MILVVRRGKMMTMLMIEEEEMTMIRMVTIMLSAVQGPGASDNMLNCAIMLEVESPKH